MQKLEKKKGERMRILSQIFKAGRNLTGKLSMNKNKAARMQQRTLRKMLLKAEYTEYGKEYDFTSILESENLYDSFRKMVPLSDYSKMYTWWQRSYHGERDICWPGKVKYFALSSGTSEGASKFIPVTTDMLKAIKKASLRQMFSIAKTDLPKDYLTKHYLMIGGSTDLTFNGEVFSGDLSGITTQNVPFWFDRLSKPQMEIRKERDWEEKIAQITAEAKKWDVVMIAGVPAWIQLLFENIIKTYNVNSIHDVWPHFSVYLHGGVALEPYKKSLDALMGRPIMYFETYLASEGFIAYQSKLDSKGMKLVFRNNMFYEFIPFNKDNFRENGELKEDPEIISIADVEINKEYAILLTTCAGAWRYMIGDVVKFVSLDECEIKITGRTKHFLSLCGEHLSVDNMNKAIEILANEYSVPFNEYTVKGVPHGNFFAHQWYIACDSNHMDKAAFKKRLDEVLKELNDDYATERLHALKDIHVELVPSSFFIEWMARNGKLGSQNKFPRVLSNDRYADWVAYLKEKGVGAAPIAAE